MLWADEGVNVWWVAAAGAAGTILSAAATAVVTLLTAYSQQRKQKRSDALEEWQEIAERQQADIDKLVGENREFRSHCEAKITELQTREGECRVEVAGLKGDIKLLESTVRRLQRLAGDEAPASVTPGLVIADVQGKIKVASPALAAILHYLPHELVGKNVEMLMSERYREAHRKGLAAVAAAGQAPWPEKVVIGEALTKEGDEVPVTIALSGWQTTSGDWLISAEVRPRQAASGDTSSGVLRKGNAP